MSLCDYCNKESKLLFICPRCGRRLCKEHRDLEDHKCEYIYEDNIDEEKTLEVETIVDEQNTQPIEIDTNIQDVFSIENESEIPDNFQEKVDDGKKYNDTEFPDDSPSEGYSKTQDQNIINEIKEMFTQLSEHRTSLAIIIIVTLITGALTGILVYPQENTDDLQQRYDTLFEYYSELQSQNQILSQDIETMTNEINHLETELLDLEQAYNSLEEDWSKLFSDQTQYVKPTVNQLRAWLTKDQTDQQTISAEYTPLHQALQLSLKAKTQGWKLGVVTLHGNLTSSLNQYTYNIVKIDDGIFEDACIYLDPHTDQIWWNSNYEIIAPNKVYSLGEYTSVNITDVNLILEP